MSSSKRSVPSGDEDEPQPPTQKKLKANNSNFVINNGAENQTANASAPTGSSSIFPSSSTGGPMTDNPLNPASELQRRVSLYNQWMTQLAQNQQHWQVQQTPRSFVKITHPSVQQAQQLYVQSTQLLQQQLQIMQQPQQRVLRDENLDPDYHQIRMRETRASSREDANNVVPGVNSIVDLTNLQVTFWNFPYYLSNKTMHALVGCFKLHIMPMTHTIGMKLQCTNHRVLLSGPEGSDIYQEALVMALASYYGAKILVLDCRENSSLLYSFGQPTSTNALKFHVRPAFRFYLPSITYLSGNVNMPSVSAETSRPSAHDPALLSLYQNSQRRVWKTGDRIIFTGLKYGSNNLNIASRGPTFGNRGKVLMLMNQSPNKIGVVFDLPIPGGNDLGGQCESRHGFICDGNELCIDMNPQMSSIDTIGVVRTILFVKHAENFLVDNPQAFQGLNTTINKLPGSVFVIGSYIPKESTIHKENPICRREREQRLPNMSKMLEIFLNHIDIHMPEDQKKIDVLKRQLARDAEFLKIRENMTRLVKALMKHGLKCDDAEALLVKNHNLSDENADKVVKWALGYQLMAHHPSYRNTDFKLSGESIRYGLSNLGDTRTDQRKLNQSLKNIATENEFEKKILEDVVQHSDIGVKFDDIGAFDNVKDTLKELVILPLQRPELFRKGQLRKPCRGILLFGPPGTGKTMLAKAVATESGANFINISQSAILSKWYGEAEKYVKAIFSVASKIAPCVVFVDEVDSLLGKRRGLEHEVTRRIKNEFMLNWDGLLTSETERVLVLAATNRPFDLDEAVIRRMPRRIMVNLPDAACRAKILEVILAQEELCPDIDINALARMTEGFSGSDLKDLCVAAAHCPVRELLNKAKGLAEGSGASEKNDDLRPLKMEDFQYASNQVRASVPADSSIMAELVQWNEQCGEGGSSSSRKNTSLSYYV